MSATHVNKTPGLIHPKQIDHTNDGDVFVNGATLGAPAAALDVTAALTTFAATGGRNGTAVAMQIAADIDTPGWVTAGIVGIHDANGNPLKDPGNDAEVYGRLTEAAGVYTVSFFTAPGAVEAAYAIPAGTLDFTLGYRFAVYQTPPEAYRGPLRARISQDPAGAGGASTIEKQAIVTLNTIPALTVAARANTLTMIINGASYPESAHAGITLAGTAVTWDPVQMGFPLETSDFVIASYVPGA